MRLPASLERYDIIEDSVELRADLALRMLRVRDVNVLVDAITELDEDERLPYWATLWPSALTLARHLLTAPRRPCRVVELGAGLGLPSITAAHLGYRVLATDYERDALAFLKQNAALNRVELETRLVDLRSADLGEHFPLVMASDILYEAKQVAPLVEATQTLLAPGGTFILADPRRPHCPQFRQAMVERGYECTEYPHAEALIIEISKNT